MPVTLHLFPHLFSSTSAITYAAPEESRNGSCIIASVSFVAETPKERPSVYLRCASRAGSGSASCRTVCSRLPLAGDFTYPRALLGWTSLTHVGMGGRGGGDFRGRRDRRRRAGPFPQSQGGGVARAQVKPTPTYPGNFRCWDSPREAGVAQGRPHPSQLLAGTKPRGLLPGGIRGPFGALGSCKQRQPPRLMEAGGAAPGAGDTRQARVSAGGEERRKGETQIPRGQGTTRQQWPGS